MKTAKTSARSRKCEISGSTLPSDGPNVAAIVGAFDKLSPLYGSAADGGRPDLQAKARMAAIQLMGAGTQNRILDAGCGNGALMLELIKKGHKGTLVGIDFSTGMLSVFMERARAVDDAPHLCRTLVEELPFAESTFDTVICVNTLHNLPTQQAVTKAVKEFMRVCKSSGHLLLHIHNANNPLVRHHFALYSRPHMPLRSYRAEWLGTVLESGGFRITTQVPIGFPIPAIAPFLLIKAEKSKQRR